MREAIFEERGIWYLKNDFDPSRSTLLLIHGLGSSATGWAQVIPHLEHSFNLIVPDIRGHGFSRRWPRYSDYSPQNVADDINELLNHLSIPHCTAIGYSTGAFYALILAARHPAKVERAIFISPTYFLHTYWRVRVTRIFVELMALFAPLFPIVKKGKHVDYKKFSAYADTDIPRFIADLRQTSIRSYLYYLKHTYNFRHDEWWRRLGKPAMVIVGRHDTLVPFNRARRLVQDLDNAHIEIIEKGNHMLLYAWPKDVAREIEKFIEKK
ncbi:MAG TPA: alpha/beta hydrolase [Candidatus Paceibacterota bacterium]|nr:alpha/beta hydrolase [Candidatus Paceibacterota bacterium]